VADATFVGLGHSVSSAGDVDGDGLDALLVPVRMLWVAATSAELT